MKLLFIKSCLIFVFSSIILFFATNKALAGEVPDVFGRVVSTTGAPIVGVWVKWTDNDGNIYYEKTDNNGNFFFNPDNMLYDSNGKMIDTNLDGVNDTYQGIVAPGSSSATRSHSCVTNPHSFSVVMPVGWTGSFSVINGVTINNSLASITLSSNIIYTSSASFNPSVTCQQTIVPAYFYPLTSSYWNDAINSNPRPAIMILNPESGPGTIQDPAYTNVVSTAQARGIKIVGYVHTSYGAKSLSEVESEIDTYKSWYDVDGIYVDEVPVDPSQVTYYQLLYNYSHSRISGSTVILNPGTFPDQVYMDASDILQTFENTHGVYQSVITPSWMYNYPPSRFFNMVYNTPSTQLSAVLTQSTNGNVGYMYVSDGALPNPWDTLPSYWNSELTQISNTCFTTAYTISGNLFVDTNRNGVRDGGEGNYTGASVQLSTGAATPTDGNGNYQFTGLTSGSYTITLTVPVNYQATSTNPQTVTVSPNAIVNFGIAPGYTITGSVFNDTNKNRIKDAGETNYTGGVTITSNGGSTVINNATGTYLINGLITGSYTISYQSIPAGYFMIYPKNGPPPSFLGTVGNNCTSDGTTGATCSGGNISNLNFAISDSIPWMQTYNFDVRLDGGITNTIPQIPVYPSYTLATDTTANNPGILFIGNSFANFGKGLVSSTNLTAGGSVYPEVYTTTNITGLKTSYTNLYTKATNTDTGPVDITTIQGCSLANCTLPSTLVNNIYAANGNLVLNAYSVPNNRNIIVLVKGNVTIRGNIIVPSGSTLLLSASGDILIDRSVGIANPASPLPAGQLQGFYSTDRNFIIQGNNDCIIGADRMLNIEGVVIVNAGKTGGKLTNNRDLCGGNPSYPSYTIKGRPDFILYAPEFLMEQTSVSKEDAP